MLIVKVSFEHPQAAISSGQLFLQTTPLKWALMR